MELQGSSRSSAEPGQDPQRVSVSGKTSRGVLHIVLLTCHVVRPVFDLIVGIKLYQRGLEKTIDWWGLTILFVFLPQLLRILVLFFSHWPNPRLIKHWKDPKKIYNESFGNIQWMKIFQALPVIYWWKRLQLIHGFLWRKEFDQADADLFEHAIELEDKFSINFHSGPQVVLQMVICFQLRGVDKFQLIGLGIHLLFLGTYLVKLYLDHPMMDHSSIPTHQTLGLISVALVVMICNLVSFGILFSYARTFMTVPIIVFFGIFGMALYYETFEAKSPDQVLNLFLAFWLPNIGSGKKYFLLKTSVGLLAVHLLSYALVFIHVMGIQEATVRYLPYTFHCFDGGEEKEKFYGQFCKVENRKTLNLTMETCGSSVESLESAVAMNTTRTDIYAKVCNEDDFQHLWLIISSIITVIIMSISTISINLMSKVSYKRYL